MKEIITNDGKLMLIDYYNGMYGEIQPPENAIGFIYKTFNPLLDVWYIGKKHLLKTKGKGKEKKVSESDWRKYYGSNDFIKNDIKTNGKDNWNREILCWCYSEIQLTYRELKYQILLDWEQENCLNNNLLGKIYKSKIK